LLQILNADFCKQCDIFGGVGSKVIQRRHTPNVIAGLCFHTVSWLDTLRSSNKIMPKGLCLRTNVFSVHRPCQIRGG